MARGNPGESLAGQRINVTRDVMISPQRLYKGREKTVMGSRFILREVLSDCEPSSLASVCLLIYPSIYLYVNHTLKDLCLVLLPRGKPVCSPQRLHNICVSLCESLVRLRNIVNWLEAQP